MICAQLAANTVDVEVPGVHWSLLLLQHGAM